jgi:hypothetical protein
MGLPWTNLGLAWLYTAADSSDTPYETWEGGSKRQALWGRNAKDAVTSCCTRCHGLVNLRLLLSSAAVVYTTYMHMGWCRAMQ